MFTQQELKQQAADEALKMVDEWVESDFVLGVGTGSTTDLFIDGLARLKKPLKGAVASSQRSAARLTAQGIRVLDLNEVDHMPLYVDGADEIDAQLHMIKGGGGAHTREKIVASVAQCFVCIADESKWVEALGRFPLPIEVIPMARAAVARKLVALGGQPVLRQVNALPGAMPRAHATVVDKGMALGERPMPRQMNTRPLGAIPRICAAVVRKLGASVAHSAREQAVMTDNGNMIIDVWGLSIHDAPALEMQINNLPGVVTCGLFAHPGADVALIATQQGVRRLTRSD